MDGVALIDKILAVPTAAAAGVQDETPSGDEREEFGVEGGEVQFGCAADEIGGVFGVESQVFVHSMPL